MQIDKNIQIAVKLLEQGELVAIPTETVYGLAANALNEEAIQKIFVAKNRPLHNPLIMHIAYKSELKKYVTEVPAIIEELIDNFSPGPITYLLPRNKNVLDIITNNSDLVAIRIPNHPLLLQLLNEIKFPLVAPSANKFGSISPTRPQHVQQQFGTALKYILDGGDCNSGLESTIVGMQGDVLTIYRHGAITQEMLQKVYPKVIAKTNNNENPEAPGMLTQHYSPKTKLIVLDTFEEMQKYSTIENIGCISFNRQLQNFPSDLQIVLSSEGSLEKAAQKLYAALYEMDSKNLDCIYIHLLPQRGIGVAINDKLKRAAAAF